MNVFIIAVQTSDGFIGKDDSHNSMTWTSQADKDNFIEKTKEAGVVLMGRKTYDTIGGPLPKRRCIVMTRSEEEFEGVEKFNGKPEDLVAKLESEGEKHLAVAGGATIYTEFLKAGVVDKIFLTVEGIIFGDGLKMYKENLDKKLKLVSNTKIGDNTVLLEYDVLN